MSIISHKVSQILMCLLLRSSSLVNSLKLDSLDLLIIHIRIDLQVKIINGQLFFFMMYKNTQCLHYVIETCS